MGKIENKGEKECSHFSLLSVEVSNQVIQASISDHTKGKAISDEIIYANEIQVISPQKNAVRVSIALHVSNVPLLKRKEIGSIVCRKILHKIGASSSRPQEADTRVDSSLAIY